MLVFLVYSLFYAFFSGSTISSAGEKHIQCNRYVNLSFSNIGNILFLLNGTLYLCDAGNIGNFGAEELDI